MPYHLILLFVNMFALVNEKGHTHVILDHRTKITAVEVLKTYE